MMKKLLCVSILLLGAVAASAQGSNGGVLYASDFANWSLPQANTPAFGQIQWTSSEICQVSATGYTFTGPKTGRPVRIVDANSSLSETVTPTNVIVNGGFCSLTASMANAHYTYHVGSGTAGLQEAIDYQSGLAQGSVVVLTPAWTLAGGTTGMITAARGNANVSILDERTNTFTAYSWNGSAYVVSPFISTGCLGGNSVANGCTGATAQPTAFNNIVGPGGTLTGPLAGTTSAFTTFVGSANLTPWPGYGDSITNGNGASSFTNGYLYQVAAIAGYNPVNYGNPGFVSQQMDSIIFSNPPPAPSTSSRPISSYLIGTNNAGADPGYNTTSTAANLADYTGNIEAQYAWLALANTGAIVKFNSGSAFITFPGGVWSGAGLFGGSDPGKTCSGLACQSVITFSGTKLFLIFGAVPGSAATASVTCDGISEPAISFATAQAALGQNETQLYLQTLAPGSHSCTIQSTSASGAMYLEWFASTTGVAPSPAGIVLAIGPPDRFPVDPTTTAYQTAQTAAAAVMTSAGLTNIFPVSMAGVLGQYNYGDGATHPNNYGYYLMAQQILATLTTATGQTYTIPPFKGLGVANLAWTGNSNFILGKDDSCCSGSTFGGSITGSFNTGIGAGSLGNLTTQSFNTAGGYNSGLTGPTRSTFFGYESGQHATGTDNSGFGLFSLFKVTTGNNNDATGSGSGQNITTGSDNSLHGFNAGNALTTGQGNNANGSGALALNVTGNWNVADGDGALANYLNSDTVAVGVFALNRLTTGTGDVGLGRSAGELLTTQSFNSIFGYEAVDTGTPAQDAAFGYRVLRADTGGNNAGFGSLALSTCSSCSQNAGMGQGAMQNLTTGQQNAITGTGGLGAATTSSFNAGSGYQVLSQLTTSTGGNSAVGFKAGVNSGTPLLTMDHDSFFGFQTSASADGLTNSTALGNGATFTASNQMVLGNASVTDVYLGSTTFAATLHAAKIGLATARKGTFTCTAGGTITITNANELTTSDVVISLNTAGGTIATPPAMKTVTNATGFSVLCAAADTSVYNYLILD